MSRKCKYTQADTRTRVSSTERGSRAQHPSSLLPFRSVQSRGSDNWPERRYPRAQYTCQSHGDGGQLNEALRYLIMSDAKQAMRGQFFGTSGPSGWTGLRLRVRARWWTRSRVRPHAHGVRRVCPPGTALLPPTCLCGRLGFSRCSIPVCVCVL